MGFGGWDSVEQPGTVKVAVPTDLVQMVAEFVADPDAFFAQAAMAGRGDGLALVELQPLVWVDPARIVAIRQGVDYTLVYVDGAREPFKVDGQMVGEVIDRLQTLLSDPASRV